MPSLGADMEAGTFVEWLVRPGQAVTRGEVLCVIETDKGAVEVETWSPGTVARLVAEPGQRLPVGALMALLATEGEAWEAVAAAPLPGPDREVQPPAAAGTPEPRTAAITAPASAGNETMPPAAASVAPPRLRASPAARRRAQELGLALAHVPCASADGVISLADVERAADPSGQPRTLATPSDVAQTAPLPATAPQAPPGPRPDAMREAIGAAMTRSKREIPHYYLGTQLDVEAACAWLERRNAAVPVTERVLFAALEIKAVALALRQVPELNGFFVDGSFRPSPAIHPGIAVSLREGGLVAPALHHADTLPLAELMTRLKDLLRRARGGALRAAERADPTVTITSLGELGVDTVYGVIQPPQVALVGFGRVAVRPWVRDGALVPARVLHASLSADHRASDGMRGARFLAALERLFQQPESLE
jgi:pyruvate dehydrogenase E2 component (dihydrolipoamide acetyltransferase)